MSEVRTYAVDPLSPFPKRWSDPKGPIRVIAGPFEGWLMVRRPGAAPFCLHVKHMCNVERHWSHGPFTVAPAKKR